MPNYDPLIEKLLLKTQAGTLPWKPTFDENTFIVALEGEVSFEITQEEDGAFQLLMKDKEGNKIMDMLAHRRFLGHPNFEANDRFFEKLRQIFEAARVHALEVEKKLDIAQNLLDKF